MAHGGQGPDSGIIQPCWPRAVWLSVCFVAASSVNNGIELKKKIRKMSNTFLEVIEFLYKYILLSLLGFFSLDLRKTSMAELVEVKFLPSTG